jgi:CBS domain-containing protein
MTAPNRRAAGLAMVAIGRLRIATADFISMELVSVPEHCSIDDALRQMVRVGMCALLVVRHRTVTGLVTSGDILGERPAQLLAITGASRRGEIKVGQIMIPWDQLPTVDRGMLGRVRFGDLGASLRRSPVTHFVIVEKSEEGETLVRGLISRRRLERMLACAMIASRR